MDTLKELDPVAYVRFASVYRNFREAKDFEDFVGSLGEPDRPIGERPMSDRAASERAAGERAMGDRSGDGRQAKR